MAKINVTENIELEEVFKTQDFPIIWFYPAGVKKIDGAIPYTGVKKKFTIVSWVNDNSKKSNNDLAELNA